MLSTSTGCIGCDGFCGNEIFLTIRDPANATNQSPDAVFEICGTQCTSFQIVGMRCLGMQCQRVGSLGGAGCALTDKGLEVSMDDDVEEVSLVVRSSADPATATVLFEADVTLTRIETGGACGETCFDGSGTFTIPP